ncbi:hypothetical protein TTHERM_00321620 (macronuclear) [Tetrahymena thermophila SB210]|uniref:Uncharacterized protein n=1 Tax=Tetrahymena thermophila (strain SB210) TaxID=312017 RepID=Q237M4_TETTS|nr:hypothetical protein TTHERM_00321620 [Tetrahymena thermophila SB210]EAR92717.2 hypothetical protein TTHERM_00321620 [Tetrahymena thermophila SB210]|eukprot:XP_001012962.2 hypothetical protein TTHERM_00321620 [Tetrahymena thermophila SB210]
MIHLYLQVFKEKQSYQLKSNYLFLTNKNNNYLLQKIRSFFINLQETQSAKDFQNIILQKDIQPQYVHQIGINIQESNWNDELSSAVSCYLKQLIQQLQTILSGNTVLEELNLQSFENSYDSEAHSYLCRALYKNNHLQKLVLQTIVEPPKFWDNQVENLSVNSYLQNLLIRFLGGGNEKRLAVALNNLYKTISPVIITVNSPHSSIQNFRQLQKIKQEMFLQLSVSSILIKPTQAVNPSQIAADLYYDQQNQHI